VFPNLDRGLPLLINAVVMEHGAIKKPESTVNKMVQADMMCWELHVCQFIRFVA
jgi:hypothetical protein